MALPSEVGLRVLLSPFGSNVFVRTACCSVGIALPVYSTFKAIEKKDQEEQQRMLLYWAAYGSFSVAEVFSDKILSWFPLYYHMKFAFLVWLQLPASNIPVVVFSIFIPKGKTIQKGARHLYMNHLRPFFRRHQVRLDQAVDFIYGQMTKFISSHQGELQFAKALFMKIVASVRGIVPGQRQSNRAIEGPAKESQDTESDIDE